MNYLFSRKFWQSCVVLIVCTTLLSGCLLGWLGVPSPGPMLERRQAQKGTSAARVNGAGQGEMQVNGHTLLVRRHYPPAGADNGKRFWRFWGIKSHDKRITEDLLVNEGILIDATVSLGRFSGLEKDIDIPCMSTENMVNGLSVAYLADNGAIVKIMDMLPDVRLPLYCAPQPVKRALLMPYGWFEANNVTIGNVVSDFEYINNNRKNQIIAQWPAPSTRQLELAEIEKSYVPAFYNGIDRIMETKMIGPWIGESQDKEVNLLIIVPSEPANRQASIERYRSLKPWDSVLYYINEVNYYDANGTYSVPRPGSGKMSVATFDKDGTIIRMFDASENDDVILHDKDGERYALITSYGWLEAYAHPSSKILLPFNPVSRPQLPQVVIKAQAQQAQTERLMELVRIRKQQDAEFLAWSRDFNQLTNHYDIQVVHHYGSPKIGGNHDRLPGLLDRLFGADGSNLRARAWQCSDRNYTVSFRPKHDIDYVDAPRNATPVAIDASWQINQVIGGNTSAAGIASAQLNLPLLRASQASESFRFSCVDDLHTDRGQETASELRMTLAGQSTSFQVHAVTPSHHINSNAVYAENSRQWGLLEQAINAHNAEVSARQGRQAGGTGSHPGYVSINVEMTCGIFLCVTKSTSASAISGSFNIESGSSRVTIWGLPSATGRVRVISSFDNNKTCAAEVNIADGNDYDLNFTTSCDIGYFNAR